MPPIIESGMTFGPYPQGHCFHIEKSATYAAIQEGVRMSEFLLLRRQEGRAPVVLVVEAKSSAPRPESNADFGEYISEIREKLVNGLALGLASCLKRHTAALGELPQPFQELDLAACSFRMVLVINGHEKAWLVPLQDALAVSIQSDHVPRMNRRKPIGVGLALVAKPQVSVERRRVGKRRPYTLLHRYGLAQALRATTRVWALGANAVAVLNEEDARKYGLIA